MLTLKPGRLIVSGRTLIDSAAAVLTELAPDRIPALKADTALPVIAAWEREDGRGLRVLTPDLDSARAMAEAGADAVLLDASAAARPVPGLLAALIRQVREELGRPVVALVTNEAEGVRAAGYGADALLIHGLAGLKELAAAAGVPVLCACGSPAEARAALRLGAGFVVGEAALEPAVAPAPETFPTAEGYWIEAAVCTALVQGTQGPAIREAAALCARSILAGGVVHIFGAGHSRAFGMELSGRAGGLVPMHVFGLEEVAPPGKRGLQLLDLERGPDTAHRLLATFPVHPADVFIIASNSGRNGCPVELALEVKRRGHPLITVTSLEHAGGVTSRHPSGKRVFELADVVIDNGTPYGDAVLRSPGLKEAVCAVSSVTGALIAQALTAETIRLIIEAGAEPPVYVSANLDGADEHNARLEARYEGRI